MRFMELSSKILWESQCMNQLLLVSNRNQVCLYKIWSQLILSPRVGSDQFDSVIAFFCPLYTSEWLHKNNRRWFVTDDSFLRFIYKCTFIGKLDFIRYYLRPAVRQRRVQPDKLPLTTVKWLQFDWWSTGSDTSTQKAWPVHHSRIDMRLLRESPISFVPHIHSVHLQSWTALTINDYFDETWEGEGREGRKSVVYTRKQPPPMILLWFITFPSGHWHLNTLIQL